MVTTLCCTCQKDNAYPGSMVPDPATNNTPPFYKRFNATAIYAKIRTFEQICLVLFLHYSVSVRRN